VAPLGRAGSTVQRLTVILVGAVLALGLVGAGIVLLIRGTGGAGTDTCAADPNGWNGAGGGPLHRGAVNSPAPEVGTHWSPSWSYPAVTGGAAVSAPPSAAAGSVFTVTADGTLVALDAASGRLNWTSPPGRGEAGAALVAPALDGCTAVVATSFADPSDGQPAGAFRAVDLASHQRRWGVGSADEAASAPQIVKGVTFAGVAARGAGSADRNYAVDGFNVGDPSSPFRKAFRAAVVASPASDGSTLWAASFDQSLYAFAIEPATRGLRQLWSFTTNGIIVAAPVVGDGVVFVAGDDGSVYALDATSGAQRWQFDAASPIDLTPVLGGGALVVAGRDGRVHALDAATGHQRWSVDIRNKLSGSAGGLALTADRVVVADSGGMVHLLALSDGAEHGTWQAPAPPRGGPAVASGMLYLTCADGRLYALPL
jgi:outer membrane protein assembly factor BamB